MDIDPMEYSGEESAEAAGTKSLAERRRARLNTMVAVTVALVATFMAICNLKDGNIVQDMQQAQAKSIDSWAWYQARNTRLMVMRSTIEQEQLQALSAPDSARARYEASIATMQKTEADERTKNEATQKEAKAQDQAYNDLNFHDDQFDASEAFISMAISLLAITSLTQKHWLYVIALVPTVLGLWMGLSGLFELKFHLDFLSQWLG